MAGDLYWSINAQAADIVLARVAAYRRHLAEKGIEDGPAMDAARDGLPIRVDNGVAVIPLIGAMVRSSGPIGRAFGLAGTDTTRLAVESAVADPDIEQILLRVDSPGGSVSGLDQLGDVVASSTKPVVAIVDGMAASAAYYVASQASKVLVGRNDLVGSIGTRMMLYDFSRAFEQEGIEAVPIDTGKFKSAGAMGTKITEEQRADFQRVVDFFFADFVAAVSRGRHMSEDAVRAVADGRVFTPQEALAVGLIDGIATYGDTLRAMRSERKRSTNTARARIQI